MDEKRWCRARRPDPLLSHIAKQASERKLRLFAVACCRRVVGVVSDERIRGITEASEEYADGLVTHSHLDYECFVAECAQEWEGKCNTEPERSAVIALRELGSRLNAQFAAIRAAEAKGEIARSQLDKATAQQSVPPHYTYGYVVAEKAKVDERQVQTQFLRDIFGNPFRPVALDAAWRTSDVLALARGIYDDRAFDRMSILADALQDAGCDADDILSHCRDPQQVHVRGCWVVDLLLGKA